MSRVITFSRVFPKYHSKAGTATYFVEKIWKSLGKEFVEKEAISIAAAFTDLRKDSINDFGAMKQIHFDRIMAFAPKLHTIRSGNRWKVGDKFSPRVWSGKPYNSKQIIIAPDMEVKKVFTLDVQFISRPFIRYKNEKGYWESYPERTFDKMALNDGFSFREDLEEWLLGNKPFYNNGFTGQIICWDENVNY